MILTRIALKDFRGYERLDLSFEKGLTVIEGENGAGKTNLAEAIYYLSFAKSWRSDADKLIRDGKDAAYIEADITEGILKRRIEFEIKPDSKKVSINGKQATKMSELSKLTNIVLFTPRDVTLFTGSPSERRNFLDSSLSKQTLDYYFLHNRYEKLLKGRNALLKGGNPDRNLLEVMSEQMMAVALPLVRYRSMYVSSINGVLPTLIEKLTGEKGDCRLIYKPFARPDDSFLASTKKLFQDALESDLRRGFTQNGPHREDIKMVYKGKDLADYGSQGENRVCALATKLAPYFLVSGEGKKPICVLDDVTSELDEGRVERLIALLRELGQVFVTTTKLNISDASFVDVSGNVAVRR
ncbi:MAG: DNA replication and repair protein RecF [Bacilli bacterium]|nr:DNA replication and repair protein RecF [Bacilli bacterium]